MTPDRARRKGEGRRAMNTCARFGKWIGGCRFEPRFDTKNTGSVFESVFGSDATWKTVSVGDGKFMREPVVPKSTKTYVRDVCTRCGRTVERPKGGMANAGSG